MERVRRWVVGLDRSPLGFDALDEALSTAAERGGEVHAVYVFQPLGDATSLYGGSADPAMHAEIERLLPEVRKRTAVFGRETPPVIVHGVVGPAADALVVVAAVLDADAIFVGTHGRSGLERMMLGSVAEKVVRRAGCPVHVCRPRAHDTNARWPTHRVEHVVQGAPTIQLQGLPAAR